MHNPLGLPTLPPCPHPGPSPGPRTPGRERQASGVCRLSSATAAGFWGSLCSS